MLIIRQRIAVLALATAALLLAACGGTAAPAPTDTAQPATSAPTTAPAIAVPTAKAQEIPYPEVPRVSLEEAKAALDAGSAIFVDVREPQSYEAEHIAGAINIPNYQIEARMGELDKQEWIIPYCT
jgi:hypothetical protein